MISWTSVWERTALWAWVSTLGPQKRLLIFIWGFVYMGGVSPWMAISPLSWPCTNGFRILATWIRGAAQVSTERLFITEGILQCLWHSVFSGKEWEDYSKGVSLCLKPSVSTVLAGVLGSHQVTSCFRSHYHLSWAVFLTCTFLL